MKKPSITSLFLLLSLIVCVWFAATNYNLHQLLQQSQEQSHSQHKQAQKQLVKLNKQVTELHGKAKSVDTEYSKIYPKLEGLLASHKKDLLAAKEELANTKSKLKETQSNNDDLKKELKGVMEVINAEHKEQLIYAGQRFRSENTIDLSVIVAYDWVDSKSITRSLSILYVMDYFNQFAAKHHKTVEVVYVHTSQTSQEASYVLTSNVVSEFKTTSSNSLETLLNEGARGAKGKHLLFIPILPSKNAQLDLELFIDIPKMLSSFTNEEVGIVGGISIHNENDTVLDSGIDFAYATKDAVTPFARYIGAGLHYPKIVESPPCVSKTGMMIDRALFESVGGFSGKYTQDIKLSSVGQLMEDSDLCLRVLEKSRKVIYIPENSIKTTHLPISITKVQQESLIMKFNSTWGPSVRKLVEAKKELHDFSLVWDLYCGCTGVNVEAINYLVAMESKLNVGAVAGDGCWCGGFPTYVQESLVRISTRAIGPKVDVWVSHKPPDKYPSFPYKGLVTVEQRPAWIIGRSMSETDTIKADWVEKSKKADEIWIPTEFHREVFSVSGVSSSMLQVVEESLDTTLYDPETTVPLPLNPIYGNSFKFLSVFKWEARKGWDILLQAYFEEFVGGADNIVLVLQTYLYGERNPRDRRRAEEKIRTYGQSLKINHALPPVLVLTDELPELKMPQLYKACDAFVLPTRGEGWGLPIMEAMAMGMPSIVTNWSGPTQFTTPDSAYLLPYDKLETVPRNFEGGSGNEKWAKPSLVELKKMMRAIYSNPSAANKVGKKAREHIKKNYDRDIIGEKMVNRLKEIQKIIK